MADPISILIPAHNEEACIGTVVEAVRAAMTGREVEILVIDDGSTDTTAKEARQAGAAVLSSPVRRGYGASLKAGIRHARHDWIVTLDGDGQHDPHALPGLLERLEEGYAMVIGARDPASFQYKTRMPGKQVLQWFALYLVGEKPRDVNSGLRVFKKEIALGYFPILPNGFSFSTTITLAMIKDAFRIGWVPIQTSPRLGRKSNVSLIRDGGRTAMLIIRIAVLFNPLKVFLPMSLLLFGLGLVYAFLNLLREFNIPDGATLCMLSGVIVFFFGVLADQLASIRQSPPGR